MAVTVGTATKYALTGKNISVNHTCAADTTMLIAFVYLTSTSNPSTITCLQGATSMVKLVEKAADTNGAYVAMFYLTEPETLASKTIKAAWSGLGDVLSRIVIFDVYGSTGIPTNAASAKGTTDAVSLNVTSTTTAIVIEGTALDRGDSDGAMGAGQTMIVKKYPGSSAVMNAYASYKAGEATTNMAYTFTGTPYWAIVGASIAGYTTPPTPPAEEILPIPEEIWLEKLEVVETDEFSVSDTILGGDTISALECRLYLGTSDKTYTCMTGNTQTFADTSYTTNKIKNLKGGNIYVLACRVTIDGKVKTRKREIHVQKESYLR